MNSLLLLGAGAGSELLAQVVTTIVTFLLVMFTLKVMAWKPILSILEERKKSVENEFSEIDRKMAEANKLLAEYQQRLKLIEDEAREIKNREIDTGKKVAADIAEKAREEAEGLIAKTKSSLQLELEKARIELRREAVELTLAASGKLLNASLDDERHRQLVNQFVDELASRKTS